jgi:hypothetical protein
VVHERHDHGSDLRMSGRYIRIGLSYCPGRYLHVKLVRTFNSIWRYFLSQLTTRVRQSWCDSTGYQPFMAGSRKFLTAGRQHLRFQRLFRHNNHSPSEDRKLIANTWTPCHWSRRLIHAYRGFVHHVLHALRMAHSLIIQRVYDA